MCSQALESRLAGATVDTGAATFTGSGTTGTSTASKTVSTGNAIVSFGAEVGAATEIALLATFFANTLAVLTEITGGTRVFRITVYKATVLFGQTLQHTRSHGTTFESCGTEVSDSTSLNTVTNASGATDAEVACATILRRLAGTTEFRVTFGKLRLADTVLTGFAFATLVVFGAFDVRAGSRRGETKVGFLRTVKAVASTVEAGGTATFAGTGLKATETIVESVTDTTGSAIAVFAASSTKRRGFGDGLGSTEVFDTTGAGPAVGVGFTGFWTIAVFLKVGLQPVEMHVGTCGDSTAITVC